MKSKGVNGTTQGLQQPVELKLFRLLFFSSANCALTSLAILATNSESTPKPSWDVDDDVEAEKLYGFNKNEISKHPAEIKRFNYSQLVRVSARANMSVYNNIFLPEVCFMDSLYFFSINFNFVYSEKLIKIFCSDILEEWAKKAAAFQFLSSRKLAAFQFCRELGSSHCPGIENFRNFIIIIPKPFNNKTESVTQAVKCLRRSADHAETLTNLLLL